MLKGIEGTLILLIDAWPIPKWPVVTVLPPSHFGKPSMAMFKMIKLGLALNSITKWYLYKKMRLKTVCYIIIILSDEWKMIWDVVVKRKIKFKRQNLTSKLKFHRSGRWTTMTHNFLYANALLSRYFFVILCGCMFLLLLCGVFSVNRGGIL